MKVASHIAIWTLILGTLTGFGLGGALARPSGDQAGSERAELLSKVVRWGYQLQKLDTAALAASPHDLLVIDHAPDRVESVELLFRRTEVEALKTKPDGGRRLVLAYISIGEAERYRFYWDEAWRTGSSCPAWLGPVNPQWVGNYPVEYWQPAWQQIMFGNSDSYVDRVLAAGFDGIYLDRADVYEQFKDRPAARRDMVRFLGRLIDHARAIKPDALVVLQNAEELLREKAVLSRIDAVAKESLYFNPDTAGQPTPFADRRTVAADLKRAQRAGRKVLLVEYTDEPAKAELARRLAARDGFLIHFAERSLSTLNIAETPSWSALAAGRAIPVRNDPQLVALPPCG